MAYETLLTELRDRVLTVTMNRPDRLNAFTTQMMLDWLQLLDEIDADDEVRAVVVTGAGAASARAPISAAAARPSTRAAQKSRTSIATAADA